MRLDSSGQRMKRRHHEGGKCGLHLDRFANEKEETGNMRARGGTTLMRKEFFFFKESISAQQLREMAPEGEVRL